MDRKCRRCKIQLTENNSFKSFIKYKINLCSDCSNECKKEEYVKNRLIVLEMLGNRCICCLDENLNHLTIDHIDGGGNKEKKKIRGAKYLRKLKNDKNITEKYRCLCYNCNYCIGFWGKCQHKL